MVIFAGVTFCLIPIFFYVAIFSHIISDRAIEYVLWPLRLIFMASPWVALFLGLRGRLPGTEPMSATKPGTRATSRILALIVMVIVGVFTLGAWVAFTPVPGRPEVSISLLGYTNDATGAPLAKIAVTNPSATTIFVYQPRIEIQAPTDSRGYVDYFSGVNSSWQSLLDSGTAGSFTIPPPTNQSPWRLSLYVYPDRGRNVKNSIKGVVAISCMSVGVWPLFAKFLPLDGAFRHPYPIEGDWIKDQH